MGQKEKKSLDDIDYDETAVEKKPTLIETISVCIWAANMFVGIGLFIFLLFFKYTRILMIIYFLWITYDNVVNKTPIYGRRSNFIKNMSIWKRTRDCKF